MASVNCNGVVLSWSLSNAATASKKAKKVCVCMRVHTRVGVCVCACVFKIYSESKLTFEWEGITLQNSYSLKNSGRGLDGKPCSISFKACAQFPQPQMKLK